VIPFIGIWGKIKIILAGAVAMLLPILYLLGRRDGTKLEKGKAVEAALKAEHEKANFYKEMEQKTNEIQNNAPRTRDDLSKRVREHGL
jgi:hypothetical protein